jgi:hypothetical protein
MPPATRLDTTGSRLLLSSLDHEWERSSTSRQWRRRLRSWGDQHAVLAGPATPDAIVDAIRSGERDHSVRITWALLDLVQGGDHFAGRTILQAIIPALMSEANGWLADVARTSRPGTMLDRQELDQLLVAEAVQAITDVAGSTRSRWPIADVVRRTHRLVLRRVRGERTWAGTQHATDPADLAPPRIDHGGVPLRTAAEELSSFLRDEVAAGVISSSDAELVWLTRIAGFPPADVTARFGQTADTLRRRRHRIEGRLVAEAAYAA